MIGWPSFASFAATLPFLRGIIVFPIAGPTAAATAGNVVAVMIVVVVVVGCGLPGARDAVRVVVCNAQDTAVEEDVVRLAERVHAAGLAQAEVALGHVRVLS